MASNLYTQLIANQYKPSENAYGVGAMSMGQLAPALYNPYASSTSNLGYSLGSSLLAGLLGGMAKKRAKSQNADLLLKAVQMQSMTDPNKVRELMTDDATNAVGAGMLLDLADVKTKRAEENRKRLQGLEDDRIKKTREFYLKQAEEGLLTEQEALQKIAGLNIPTPDSYGMSPKEPTANQMNTVSGRTPTDYSQISSFSASGQQEQTSSTPTPSPVGTPNQTGDVIKEVLRTPKAVQKEVKEEIKTQVNKVKMKKDLKNLYNNARKLVGISAAVGQNTIYKTTAGIDLGAINGIILNTFGQAVKGNPSDKEFQLQMEPFMVKSFYNQRDIDAVMKRSQDFAELIAEGVPFLEARGIALAEAPVSGFTTEVNGQLIEIVPEGSK